MTRPKRRGLERGRRKQGREKRKRHLIVSNGKVTETEYFETIIEEMGVRGSVLYRHVEGDPLTVIRRLSRILELDKKAEERNEIEAFSSIWVVVDADEFLNLGQAEREGRKHGYRLVMSSPCFEVWLIDHDSPCPDSCATSAQCSERARNLGILRPTNPKRKAVEKCKSIVLESVRGKYREAVDNASRHNSETKRRVREANPDDVDAYAVWTDMPELMKVVFGL